MEGCSFVSYIPYISLYHRYSPAANMRPYCHFNIFFHRHQKTQPVVMVSSDIHPNDHRVCDYLISHACIFVPALLLRTIPLNFVRDCGGFGVRFSRKEAGRLELGVINRGQSSRCSIEINGRLFRLLLESFPLARK
jgi:hypothetical protein